MIKRTLITLSLVSSLSLPMISSAETAVIVHPSNGNASLDQGTVKKIFLGKAKKFPDGSQAIPIDQGDDSPVKKGFLDTVVGKSPSQLKSYWSKRVFTGKGTPPKQVGSGADVKKLVAENPATIGYIDSSEVDGTVKVVMTY